MLNEFKKLPVVSHRLCLEFVSLLGHLETFLPWLFPAVWTCDCLKHHVTPPGLCSVTVCNQWLVYSGQTGDGWIVWCKGLFCSYVTPNTWLNNSVPIQPWTRLNAVCLPLCYQSLIIRLNQNQDKNKIKMTMMQQNKQNKSDWHFLLLQGCFFFYCGAMENKYIWDLETCFFKTL